MKKYFISIAVIITLVLLMILANYVKVSKSRIWQHEISQKSVQTEQNGEFNTHLPIITIDTNGQTIPEDENSTEEILSNIVIYDNENYNNYYQTSHH